MEGPLVRYCCQFLLDLGYAAFGLHTLRDVQHEVAASPM